MTKAIVMLNCRSGMNMPEFRRYWLEEHGPLMSRLPGLRRYVQDQVAQEKGQEERPCDGIEELYFDSPEALETALASREAVEALSDLKQFADIKRSGVLFVEEVPVGIQAPAR